MNKLSGEGFRKEKAATCQHDLTDQRAVWHHHRNRAEQVLHADREIGPPCIAWIKRDENGSLFAQG